MTTSSRPIPEGLPESSVDSLVPGRSSAARSGIAFDDSPTASLPVWSMAKDQEATTAAIDRADPREVTNKSGQPAVVPEPARPGQGYRLLNRVGQGGMGEVWAALQATLARPVAVKRLLPSRLTQPAGAVAESISEFQLEAMVAGRLEHPNILPIHDLGADERGLPLIAMKLVEGTTWNSMTSADYVAMPPQEFLAKHLPILLAVANAVAFAHDRGVIHRDLKPAQVMVGAFGEVLLMDWGLAIAWKDTAQSNVPRLALPMPEFASSPAGTPALMAPEQTEQSAKRVGPHTDVFLLGGTLYYLLTGTYPYQAPTALAALIKATDIEQERPEARTPDRWIPKELADIAMKALAPAPAQRYPDTASFRQAVADWMTGAAQRRKAQALIEQAAKDLEASPSTYGEFDRILHALDRARTLWSDAPEGPELMLRTREGYALLALAANDLTLARAQAAAIDDDARRKPLSASIEAVAAVVRQREAQRRWAIRGVVGLLLALLISAAAFTYSLNQSRLEAVEARREAEAAKGDSDRQRDKAEEARHEAEQLIEFMLGDLTDKLRPIGRLAILDSVLKRVDGILDKRRQRGMTHTERGSLVKMLALVGDVRMSQGQTSAALESFSTGLDISLRQIGRNPSEEKWRLSAAEGYRRLGGIALAQGNMAGAEDHFRRYRDLASDLVSEFPESTRAARELSMAEILIGDILRDTSRMDQCRPFYDRAVQIRRALLDRDPTHPDRKVDMTVGYNRLGILAARMGDRAKADEAFSQALAITEELAGLDPTNAQWQLELASSLNQMGDNLEAQGRLPEAHAAFQRSLDAYKRISEIDPDNAGNHREVSLGWHRLATVTEKEGDLEAALEMFGTARDIMEDLVARDPSRATWHHELAINYNRMSRTLQGLGKSDEALSATLSESAILENIVAMSPESMAWQRDLATSSARLGGILETRGDFEGATRAYRRMRDILAALVEKDGSNAQTRRDWASSFVLLSRALSSQGKREEALESIQIAVPVFQQIAAADPTNRDRRLDAALTVGTLGVAYQGLGRFDEAQAALVESLETIRGLVQQTPTNAIWRNQEAVAIQRLGSLYAETGRLDEAMTAFTSYRDIMAKLVDDVPANARFRRELTISWMNIGNIAVKQGKKAEARDAYTKNIELAEQLVAIDATNMGWQMDLAAAYNRMGALHEEDSELNEALVLYEKSYAIVAALGSGEGRSAEVNRSLGVAFRRLGGIHVALGNLERARPLLLSAKELLTTYPAADSKHLSAVESMLASMDATTSAPLQSAAP